MKVLGHVPLMSNDRPAGNRRESGLAGLLRSLGGNSRQLRRAVCDHPLINALALAMCVVALARPASAQVIHTYGNDGGDTSASGGSGEEAGTPQKTWYPGMPTPKSNQATTGQARPSPAKEAAGKGKGGDQKQELSTASHRITVFSADARSTDSPRTTLDLALDKLYSGVIPGKRNHVAHLSKATKSGEDQNKPNQLTWIGFRPKQSTTRIFVETARKADYHIRRKQDPARVEIIVENTDFSASNFRRSINTSFFERNVTRIGANPDGESAIEIGIDLERFEQPTVHQNGSFLYLDFPHSDPSDSPTNKLSQKNRDTNEKPTVNR